MSTASAAQFAANRTNAQSSQGPTSPEGKAKSSMNAVKTGLTARAVLLPSDDAAIYQQHLDSHFKQFTPATDEEKSLVQTIADFEWRLLRIMPLEAGIYAIGMRELAGLFPEESNPLNRAALIQAQIFLTYRKDLTNLSLQERRLRNQRDTDIAQLDKLQTERRTKEAADLKRAIALYKSAQQRNIPFDPAAFGFVFSVQEIEVLIQREQALAAALGLAPKAA
jgi:hypothetical protein